MIRVGIVGCTGYTAIEAIRLVLKHPQATISVATSRQAAGEDLGDLHPQFHGRTTVQVENLDGKEIAERCDVALCCLPHAASAPIVESILEAGAKVVDLSADYRLSSQALYETWYEVDHPAPSRLGNTPYGLPELYADSIRGADLVANPGCYPTSAILPLAPLTKAGLIELDSIIVDSKSGVSGAGRSPKLGTLYAEANESFAAYGVGTHRHQPEIVDIVNRFAGKELGLVFTPHLVPMDRGILSTIYVRATQGESADSLMKCLSQFYEDKPFVRVTESLPKTKQVAFTNFCDIAIRQSGDWVLLVSVIDNLVKGASGAAVQCMNLMFGLEETIGFDEAAA
ncbi:MAG: N-acetyl-gamma-glutamyl-phosphate reductase [Pirellulaceae bacterium]